MRNYDKRSAALALVLVILLGSEAGGQTGELRVWTDTQGRTLEGRLMKIEKEAVIVKVGIKEFRLELEKLSERDKRYVEELRPKPPLGKVTDFAIDPPEELKMWLGQNHMRSLQWNGKPEPHCGEMTLPFQLHIPPTTREDKDEKLPLLLHLHGTGGIGKDNLRQLTDGGDVSRLFMEERFQKYQKTYIMLPQTAEMSGWANLSWTEPACALSACVHAIRILAETPGYRIDLSRIYVTGLSMGASGAFQGMAKFPGFFAAAVPISYVCPPKLFNEGNAGPMWVVINAGDENFEERLKKFRRHYLAMGGTIRATVNDGKGHDAWTDLLSDHSFRNWLFRRNNDDE